MKKLLSLAVALSAMLCLTGCMKMETEMFESAQQELPFLQNWETFAFKSLQGKENLVVTRTSNTEEQNVAFETSKYKQPFLGVVVCKKKDEVCKQEAFWVDEFLTRFPQAKKDADWVIVFLDIFDEKEAATVPWIKGLSNLDAYTNVVAGCAAGACYKVFAPYMMEPLSGNLYYVNRSDGAKSRKIVSWNSSENPLKLYATIGNKIFESGTELTKGVFDVSEYSWEDGAAPVSDWKSFTFKSLNGGEDLEVAHKGLLAVEMAKYASPFTAVAVCKKNDERCKQQAVWFDKLAGELPTRLYGINWAIVFLDAVDEGDIKEMEWIKDLAHADVYANTQAAADKVFTPYMLEPEAGNLYFINKNDFSQNRRGVTWNTAADPQELYDTMTRQAAAFAGLQEITFDASVVVWEKGGTTNVNM